MPFVARYIRRRACVTLRGLVLEFGSAEVLNSLLVSPVLMYISIQPVPNLQLAVVLNEIADSVAFYSTVVVARIVRRAVAQHRDARRVADHDTHEWITRPMCAVSSRANRLFAL